MTLRDETDLDAWLARLDARGTRTVSWAFPNETLKSTYLDTISERSEDEVRALLRRFLIQTGSLGSDQNTLEMIPILQQVDPDGLARLLGTEHVRRLLELNGKRQPPWEGITWVLDLLPQAPGKAIEVIASYISAHLMRLPDGRISGLTDAQAVIRAMWIGNPRTAQEKRDVATTLGAEPFEHLIESLYNAMGFTTAMTPRGRDGGRDIDLVRDAPGARERSVVECKLWTRRVGELAIRNLLAVVAHRHALKGTLVTVTGFSATARAFAADHPELELIDWEQLLPLLDEHLGAEWARDIDWHLTLSRRRTGRGSDGRVPGLAPTER
jgi:restriction system protein